MILLIIGNMGCGKTTLRKGICEALAKKSKFYTIVGGWNKHGSDVSRLRKISDLREEIKCELINHAIVIVETIRFNKNWISWLKEFKKEHNIVIAWFNLSREENLIRFMARERKIKSSRQKAFNKYFDSINQSIHLLPEVTTSLISVNDSTKTDETIRKINAYLYPVKR